MKSIVIEKYGDVNEFKEIEEDLPSVSGHEVLVEVYAVAINPIDWKIRAGYMKDMMRMKFPIVFGWDISGVVSAVGDLVNDFKVGDPVFAKANIFKPGGFADFIVIEASLIVHKPEALSYEVAAAIPLAGLTAWQMLVDAAHVQSGDKVLVQAGSGGVGIFAIQFAKYFGAHVTSTTSGKNVDFVRSLGADGVINYQEEDFSDQVGIYDVVLDTMGGDILEKSYDVLKQGGRLITIAGQPDEARALEKGISVTYVNSGNNTKELAEIGKLVADGRVKVTLDKVFPFTVEGVRNAHLLSETGHARGKIIVKMK